MDAGAGADELLGLGALDPRKGDGDGVSICGCPGCEEEGACGTWTGEGVSMGAGAIPEDTGEGDLGRAEGDNAGDAGEGERPDTWGTPTGDGALGAGVGEADCTM